MDFASYECEVAFDEGFTNEKDIFRRKPFATAITSILEKSSRSISFLIDARWGEGKTTFLRMWSGELHKAGFPVIYFDAFKTDYCSDPFEALSAAITDFVSTNLSTQKELKKEIVRQAGNRLKVLSKAGLKIGAQALVHHLIGDQASTTLKEVEGELAKAAEKSLESFWQKEIQDFSQEAESIERLKAAISRIPEKYSPEAKPLIFIIDELDRCKPDYAIALLERIKHFMTTKNVHYVFAANNQQLAASAGSIYGPDIDADAYFQKFFDFKFALPTTNEKAYYKTSAAMYAHRLLSQSMEKFEFLRKYSEICSTFAHLAEKRRPPLRTLEKINDQLILAYSQDIRKHSFIDAILISSTFIKHCDRILYNKLLQQKLNFDDIETYFDTKYISNAQHDDDSEHTVWYTLLCWGRCLLEKVPESDSKMLGAASMLGVRDVAKFPASIAQRHIEQFNLQ